jgi:deoxycytidylate deaminase
MSLLSRLAKPTTLLPFIISTTVFLSSRKYSFPRKEKNKQLVHTTMTETTTAQTSQPTVPPLSSFPTFGWKPDPNLTDDVNFMDLVLLITRTSQLLQGSMACILVRDEQTTTTTTPVDEPTTTATTADQLTQRMEDAIVSIANNQWFYKMNESDVHAEIVALGQAARAGRSTDRCTAYITMPPCKRCLAALYTAGITRIVSRHPMLDMRRHAAESRGIELVDLPADIQKEQRARIDALVQTYYEEEGNTQENTAAA